MDEILDLLRSSVNEKKFAGLLLATKLLPPGDEAAVTAVHDAVGITFINQLLLGLSTQAASRQQEPVDEQVRIASAGLGLAVLACFTSVAALAQSQDIIQDVPLLLKVLRDGGIAAGGSADDAAVQDALETLVNIVRTSEEGQLVALQSGAITAAVTTLQRAATSAQTPTRQAVVLLSGLLQTPLRAQLLTDEGEALAAVVPTLAVLLTKSPPVAEHVPQVANSSSKASEGASVSITDLLKAAAVSRQSGAGSQAAASSSNAQQAEQSITAIQESPEQGAAGEVPQAPVAAADDAAAAQLEVLHALLLLLPAPEGSKMAAVLSAAAVEGGNEASWTDNVRRGLQRIMSAAAPAVTKQAALSLAAAVVDLIGPAWLAGESPPQGSSPRGAFYQLVTELAAIETKVLLMDALRSNEAAAAGPTTAQTPAAGTRVQDVAEALLPVCFRLLEAAVEVLATDSEQAGSPALDDRVAARAIDTLNGAFEAVLQYLEQSLPSTAAGSGDSDSPLQLAALRALASYLADVPQAHSDRVRTLLPGLIGLTGGTGSSAQAVAFLLPVLSQNTGLGLEQSDDIAAGSSAADSWLAAVQDDRVILAIARAAADLATQARAAFSVQSSEYAEDMLLDMWAILACWLSPTNRRNADAFDMLRQTSPAAATDAAAMTEVLSSPMSSAIGEAVAAFSSWWAERQYDVGDRQSLPPLRQHRLTVLAGSAAASFAALSAAMPLNYGVQQSQQKVALLPPDAMRLVAAALELSCRFGLESQYPSDVPSDDESSVLELLDVNTGHMLDLLHAVAVTAAADPALRKCLRGRPWVQQLSEQLPPSEAATQQEPLSISSRLHRLVALLTDVA